MTDTIKISRELRPLLERIADHLEWDGGEEMTVIQYAYKCDGLAEELRALLSTQPSEPQGGEEVEVVAHMHKGGLRQLRDTRGEDWSPAWNRPRKGREPLMTVAQHRRLMAEQLERERGVAEALRNLTATMGRHDTTPEEYNALAGAREAIAAWERNHGK